MAKALRDKRPLALFAEIEHPDGTAYLWSGIGPIEWDGRTWTGVGKFGGVAPVNKTSELAIQEVIFSLTGVSPSDAEDLSSSVRNLHGTVWLACLGERGDIISDPYQLLSAQLDFQTLSIDDDGTATISITARTGFYTLERAIDEVWSTEDQKRLFPGDTGLDRISKLMNQDIVWEPLP